MTIMQARKDKQDAAFFRNVEKNRRGFIIPPPQQKEEMEEESSQQPSIEETPSISSKDKLSLDR